MISPADVIPDAAPFDVEVRCGRCRERTGATGPLLAGGRRLTDGSGWTFWEAGREGRREQVAAWGARATVHDWDSPGYRRSLTVAQAEAMSDLMLGRDTPAVRVGRRAADGERRLTLTRFEGAAVLVCRDCEHGHRVGTRRLAERAEKVGPPDPVVWLI